MRVFCILAAVVLVALLALTQWPGAAPYHDPLSLAAIAASVILLIALIAQRSGPREVPAAAPEPVTAASVPVAQNQAEAEVISFLGTLQENGRFVDFLMEDISAYDDAQVAAAARVVHEGCRSALKEHITVSPVRTEREGTQIVVPEGFAADEYRLLGKLDGQAPFSGTLIHRGWKVDRIKLPRVLAPEGDRLPAIAPAEVELK